MEIADRVCRSEVLWTAEEDLRNNMRDKMIPISKGVGAREGGRDVNSRVPFQPKRSTCIIARLV